MGLTARIASAAGISLKSAGSLQLVSSKDTDAFLGAASTEHVAILGIEGFHLEGSRIVPDMSAIADFSELPRDEEFMGATIEEARTFLRSFAQADMYFDFLLDESRR